MIATPLKRLAKLALMGALIFPGSIELRASEPSAAPDSRGDVIVVVGSPGTDEYAGEFSTWATRWRHAALQGQWTFHLLESDSDVEPTLEALEGKFAELEQASDRPLWLVFIGHGTFDGRSAKFALPGPDLEPEPLRVWLDSLVRPTAVMLCFSASAPFLPALSDPRRILISATNSGNEVNYSRFGGHLAEAIGSSQADLDKDEQTSLLEAFLYASRKTQEFYETEGRLLTEHAVLDDNGDGRPVPPEGFSGVRPVNRDDPRGRLPDGLLAHQWHLIAGEADAALPIETLARRNALELEIARHRERKGSLPESEYVAILKSLLLELADLLLDQDREEHRPPAPPLPEKA